MPIVVEAVDEGDFLEWLVPKIKVEIVPEIVPPLWDENWFWENWYDPKEGFWCEC
jgi:hypothetical protein